MSLKIVEKINKTKILFEIIKLTILPRLTRRKTKYIKITTDPRDIKYIIKELFLWHLAMLCAHTACLFT
jgi:hypothetical protein